MKSKLIQTFIFLFIGGGIISNNNTVRDLIEELNRNKERDREIRDELKKVQKQEYGDYTFELNTDGEIFITRNRGRGSTDMDRIFMEPEAIDELIKWLNRIDYISVERLISQELSDPNSS